MKIPDSIPWRATGKTLGGGGQANVHLVTRRDQSDGQKYALKVLRNVSSRQARERFRREIEAVKGLDCPLIAKIIDHSEPDNEFQYYTMNYYEGAKTLSDILFLGSNPFHGNALKSLGLFEQLVQAIRACEESKSPVIHRDIKPDNILFLPDETIRLIDFGICQIQDGQIITFVDENVGARNYAAPECEAGNDEQISVHSDLYSAAKVLWSTVTSQRAFAREEPVFGNRSMNLMFLTEPLTWHLDLIFEKTIRANPADRFQKSEQLLERIKEVRYLVERKFPPLLELEKRCPSCGHADITGFPQGHAVFGNPNPPGVKAYICKYCGFGFVRNVDYLRENYQRLLSLK